MDESATAILNTEGKTRVLDDTPAVASPKAGSSSTPNRRWLIAGLLGFGIITILGVGSYFYYGRAGTQISSVAVLPFV
ncbi:MAG TPA: hypothetical protein VM939_12055, partial [Gemmatimonadaceae bacterium]|nr:hypothetical protein [Gemmatimonadaceae bacterium]